MTSAPTSEHPPLRASGLLVAGTSSDAGKSLVTTGICRFLARQGISVAPFKAQNMSNNSMVCADGSEIGRAQYLQAQAARAVPESAMNPVLLKPASDRRSHIVVRGRPAGTLRAGEFATGRAHLAQAAFAANHELAQRYEVIVDGVVAAGVARWAISACSGVALRALPGAAAPQRCGHARPGAAAPAAAVAAGPRMDHRPARPSRPSRPGAHERDPVPMPPDRRRVGHVAGFARMIKDLSGDKNTLTGWMVAVDHDLPAPRSFTVGLRRDIQAVTAGLTLPYNSGAVEGTGNKIKARKMQLLGRATTTCSGN